MVFLLKHILLFVLTTVEPEGKSTLLILGIDAPTFSIFGVRVIRAEHLCPWTTSNCWSTLMGFWICVWKCSVYFWTEKRNSRTSETTIGFVIKRPVLPNRLRSSVLKSNLALVCFTVRTGVVIRQGCILDWYSKQTYHHSRPFGFRLSSFTREPVQYSCVASRFGHLLEPPGEKGLFWK